MAERIPGIAADRRRSNEIETRSNGGVTLERGGGGRFGKNGLGMSNKMQLAYIWI